MADYRTIPAAELGKGSNIKVELCETEVDLYWKMAIEVLELIQENNAKGEKTVMIVPYGPLGPYARLVELINKHRVSLKNCWFINMDEYLDENKQYLPKTDPLSFRGGMDRIFYGLVDPSCSCRRSREFSPSRATKAASGRPSRSWASWICAGAASASRDISPSMSRRNPVRCARTRNSSSAPPVC